ncbi:uncharacterized protein F4822DRAFT_433165 [Hypoxylon trugodes]|uniref:uncharacterized protein n=1 Tax=Hypoxylon trugodes TaxID=326681 RepID=UPI002190F2F6|nr:uncharacterized protein F4822DRAFT_433165 [Hypoxylon trugodes]KAI1384624.1 hypothetical protein F4822DRAFT_433165 [Hypoxylon trugodes]
MPPSNSKRQPRKIRPWKQRSQDMDRRSKFQRHGSLRYRNTEDNSSDGRGLKPRLVSRGRDEDGGSGGRGDNDNGARNFGELDDDSDDSDGLGDLSDEDNDSVSDFSDDEEDEGLPPPPPPPQPTGASSSGSFVTLTALPPSKVTSQPQIVTVPVPQAPSPSLPVVLPATLTKPGLVLNPTTDKKEEGDVNTALPSFLTTTSVQSIPTPTSIETATAPTSSIYEKPEFSMADDDNNDNDGGKHKYHGDKDSSRGGLDSTAEHLLIAAGAIGAFILFCFIGWIVYRVLKRSKGQSFSGGRGMGFIGKLYGRRKEPTEGTWDGRTMYMANEAPPLYEKGEYGTIQSGTYYGPGKPYLPGPGSLNRSASSVSGTGTLQRPMNENPALASIIDQYQPGNGAAVNNSNVDLTLRSQMSQPYYTEADVIHDPPEMYNVPKRAGNRASELSSISSGFGDGDIIIPPQTVEKPPVPQIPDTPAARESWMSREGDRRETVYTTTSEDRPARFRSITSWVNQQAGRAKRAGSRAKERGEVPVMPAIPGEISATQQTTYR